MMTVWEEKYLSEVCSKIADGSHNPPKGKESGRVMISGRNVTDAGLDLRKVRYISEEDFALENKRTDVKSGDVLLTIVGTIGRTTVFPEDFPKVTFQRSVAVLKPDRDLDPYFLSYCFRSPKYQEYFENNSRGVAQKGIYLKQLNNIIVPVPSLPEQKRIVAKLDKALEAIDKAKANVERNLQNAKNLFQSELNQIFSQKGDGWIEKKLGKITTKIGSGATPRGGQASYKETGTPLIRSMNVHDDGFREKNIAFIDDGQASKLDNVSIEKNDVLLNITGASVARCCVVPDTYIPARVNQHVSIIRLEPEIMLAKYLHYCLIADENKKLLLGIGEQGATRQAITKAQIENFEVSFPHDVRKQLMITDGIDRLKLKTESLQSTYYQEIDALDELKKSILQKAFSGEL
jgi:type I restriction enzyme, S subunit